jgi:hypothetical protein
MTPGIWSTLAASTLEASRSWKRSRVAQWVRLSMFSGPPTSSTIACAADRVGLDVMDLSCRRVSVPAPNAKKT